MTADPDDMSSLKSDDYFKIAYSVPSPILITRHDGSILFANESFFEEMRVPSSQPRHGLSILDPSLAPREDTLRRIEQDGFARFEAIARRMDGTTTPILISSRVFEYRGERVYLSGFTDIGPLKAVEDRLNQAQRIAHIGNYERDMITGESFWSEEAYRILGLDPSRKNASFAVLLSCVHPEDATRVATNHSKENLSKGQPEEIEYRIVRPDGEVRLLSGKTEIERDSAGNAVKIKGTVEDVTEVRRAQELLALNQAHMIETSKMSALGQMAAGMAHEINNPLTIVLGHAARILALVRQTEPPLDRIARLAREIETTGVRITRIIKGLLAFAGNGEREPLVPTLISSIIEDTLALCRHRFEEGGIRLEVGTIPAALGLPCRSTKISQALLNLLNNACDAVEALEEKWVRIEAGRLDAVVEISVTDSGPGIPARNREKIMEPFFTTKEVGKGTGLGLSIARGLAEENGGLLQLDTSCPNTRFTIRLPVAGG